MATRERFWSSRLRWRLRGAWQWPAFAVLTVVDGLILHLLPPMSGGVELVPALIVASFGNLVLMGAVAPWLARRLLVRARRARTAQVAGAGVSPAAPLRSAGWQGIASAPHEVVGDRTATALLCAGALGLVAAGLAARPVIVTQTDDEEQNAR